MQALVDLWLRRWWRATPARDVYAGLQPVTVVTGASEGIGRALALRFAAIGNPVMLVARHAEALAEAARKVEALPAAKAFIVVADLSTADGIAAVDEALAARRAYCDVLINNAAIGLSGPFAEQDGTQLAQLLDLNVRGLTLLMHRYLPGMLARGRGGVVNVASLGGYVPGPHQAAYYASKAYVVSLTEAVASETRGMGVRVCVLAPGPVDTGFHKRMGAQSAHYALLARWTRPEFVVDRAYRGFRLGQTVVIPGIAYRALSWLVRVVPHPLLVPLTGWLLKRRG